MLGGDCDNEASDWPVASGVKFRASALLLRRLIPDVTGAYGPPKSLREVPLLLLLGGVKVLCVSVGVSSVEGDLDLALTPSDACSDPI